MEQQASQEALSRKVELYSLYLKIIVALGVLLGFYYGWFVSSSYHAILISFIVDNTSALLNAVNFDHSLHFDRQVSYAEIKTEVGGGIVNGGLVIINRSSDAMLEVSILLATILAWKGTTLWKILFALGGVIMLVALNLIRIAALVMIDHFWPLYFPMMKDWVFPILMISIVLIYFFIWTRIALRKSKPIDIEK